MRRALNAVLAAVLILPSAVFVRADAPGAFSHATDKPGKIALTFDDGPHGKYTPEILDILSEYGVRATFFVVGENARLFPELVKREAAEGHEIGNHTGKHEVVRGVGEAGVKRRILEAEDAILEAVDCAPVLFRPPEGKLDRAAKKAAADLGYQVVLWSVDTRDWANRSADGIVSAVLDNVTDGDVILCHDFISGESHTAEALRVFIPELLERGFSFVTVSELSADGGPGQN